MQAIAYYLTLPFLFLFSVLPLTVLHLCSDVILFPLLYYVVGYRKGVVRKNLKNAFPEKPSNELLKIEKKFYHHLSDIFVETIKMFSVTKRELQKRFKYENMELLNDLFEKNKSVVLTLGHYGNYEWLAMSLGCDFKHLGSGPYREMHNPYFDKLFLRARSKFGTKMFPTYDTFKVIGQQYEKPIIVALANDQSAPPHKAYWTTFLNQDTSFFVGTERIAKKKDFAVVYAEIQKVKRGYYSTNFSLITDTPKDTKEGFIMKSHANLLETSLVKEPSPWLWTHKRWKNPKPSGLVNGFATKTISPKS